MKKVYITSAEQISIQQPLCEEWMLNPIVYTTQYARSVDPNFKEFLSMNESRRLGKILKRALVTSLKAIEHSGTEIPDAIITGTGLGCIENTEAFLDSLCRDGERLLKPTLFMQSTHNTISSLIAIHTKNQGYNMTYSQKGMSFDSAMLDAWNQFRLHKIESALIGGHDEMTPSYFTLLQRIGYVGGDMKGVCGECAVSMVLSSKPDKALCEYAGTTMLYQPSDERLKSSLSKFLDDADLSYQDIDLVMTGINGMEQNDTVYQHLVDDLVPDKALMRYKNIFGECYSSSGLGIYAAAECLKAHAVPKFMRYGTVDASERLQNILIINQYEGKMFSFTILKSICSE